MSGVLPGVPLVALSRATPSRSPGLYPSTAQDLVDAALATGASAVAPAVGMLDADLVAIAHAAGLKVFPWTLETGEEISAAAGLGVDGICVNDVAMARRALTELGKPVPPAARYRCLFCTPPLPPPDRAGAAGRNVTVFLCRGSPPGVGVFLAGVGD